MKINYNISAIVANDSLNRNDHRLSASSQRLASGLKINQAKDNPSGIAIGKKMKAHHHLQKTKNCQKVKTDIFTDLL